MKAFFKTYQTNSIYRMTWTISLEQLKLLLVNLSSAANRLPESRRDETEANGNKKWWLFIRECMQNKSISACHKIKNMQYVWVDPLILCKLQAERMWRSSHNASLQGFFFCVHRHLRHDCLWLVSKLRK